MWNKSALIWKNYQEENGTRGILVMKRVLALVIVLGIVLTLFLSAGKDRQETLTPVELSSLLTSGGVQVEGYELEGWAVARDSMAPSAVWKKTGLEKSLGLAGGKRENLATRWGDCFRISGVSQGTTVRVVVQQVAAGGGQEGCYLLIKCTFAGENREILSWEKQIRRALASLGGEYRVYITVKGKICDTLDETAQLAWAQAICQELKAPVVSTLRSENYLSLTGYSPLLPDVVQIAGKKTNLNLAIVDSEKAQETHIYLGTPLISCEY